ncbi:MAG: S49 family peptidase [Halomonadaceae bacterium]|nr:MAG: S49 family peptidase [Halomonadaceae bacterium]
MSDWDSKSDTPDWGAPVPGGKDSSGGNSGSGGGQPPGSHPDSKEWRLIEKTMLSMQTEAKRGRRWGIFFKSLTFLYLFALLFLIRSPFDSGTDRPAGKDHTAVIDVRGVIAEDQDASADNLATALRRAFEAERSKAIILRINSPGGSPVQSGYVYDEIKRLRDKHPEKKVYAVISDLGASGAYYIAAAADEIYANKSSLVGSIGVIGGGFGFTGTMEKLGIERRIYTSGDNKAFLDPFSPEREEEVVFWESVLDQTHQQFIADVQAGRGDRLADDEDLFSGLIWNGEKALGLGLVDGLGSAGYVAREVVGYEEMVDYSFEASPFQRLMRQLGTSVGRGLSQALRNEGPRLQ